MHLYCFYIQRKCYLCQSATSKMVKKPWLCECYPQGRTGKCVRKRFATKGEATAFELHLLKEVDEKPWMGEQT